jgi:tRNA dimethylallyltransferase
LTQGETLRALVICGPTASGKSAVAVRLCERLGGEIVNADSRQVYRGMRIGTGMPKTHNFDRVPHHLYGFLDPSLAYSAAQFVGDASPVIEDICGRNKLPVVVGGTGFYVESLVGTMTLDRPPPDDAIRERLRSELHLHGSRVLWDWLHARRPAIAAQIPPNDSYRIVRGLETTMSQQQPRDDNRKIMLGLRSLVVRLVVPRVELHRRIEHRVRDMFREGLVQEAIAVRKEAPAAPGLTGIGYAEALALWLGLATQSEAIARTIVRTEQYSKRQETWFRHMREAIVVAALNEENAVERIAALARERFVPK